MGLFSREDKVDPNSESRDWQLVASIAQESLKEQKKARRWGVFFKMFACIYVLIILVGVARQNSGSQYSATQEHVGVVYLDGVIAADQTANANDLVGALRAAFESSSSKAVILAINSPGGSPVQSGYVYDEIRRLRTIHTDKKLYAVISDLGASGGYYIAAAADEIYADKSSLVGSIGVTAASFGFVDLMKKLGVERRSYTSGEHKSFLDPFAPQREDEKVFWEGVLSTTHEQFIEAVEVGRGDRLIKDDEDLYSGLVWSGEQALELGLIDGLGSAGYVAREVINIEQVVDYTLRPTPFEAFSKNFGVSVGEGIGAVLNTVLNTPVKLSY
ncbi:MAG: protease-4 [Candidatus Endobugula sp.]|jgi:protease-4